ncbi:hypothetical protein BJ322DRAFT_1021769 [Thelephora terrestris]|uniref:Uncharacterized protein n=1 Tax=Thelephora terrestris TaxID=56493 RepID=A0A9P6HDX7_9AGAM|nr:hypothetical protein BJ322DRAFT_1021769 [Thelephora terrestris]
MASNCSTAFFVATRHHSHSGTASPGLRSGFALSRKVYVPGVEHLRSGRRLAGPHVGEHVVSLLETEALVRLKCPGFSITSLPALPPPLTEGPDPGVLAKEYPRFYVWRTKFGNSSVRRSPSSSWPSRTAVHTFFAAFLDDPRLDGWGQSAVSPQFSSSRSCTRRWTWMGWNARTPLRNVPSHTTVTHFSAVIGLPLDGSFVELSNCSTSTLSSLYTTTDPNHAGHIFAKPNQLSETKKVTFDAPHRPPSAFPG